MRPGDKSEAKLVPYVVVEPRKDDDRTGELESVAHQSLKESVEIKFWRGRIGGLGHKSPSLPGR